MKTLKKSLALLLLTTAIVSCAKKSNDELIIGTWNCTSAKTNNVEAIGTSLQSLKWTFNENGKVYYVQHGIVSDSFYLDYIINETQLIFMGDNDTFNIDKLTETKLELHFDKQNGTNTTHNEAKFDKM